MTDVLGEGVTITKEGQSDAFGGEILTINVGPHHPSTHGVLRLIVDLDGEQLAAERALVLAYDRHALGRLGFGHHAFSGAVFQASCSSENSTVSPPTGKSRRNGWPTQSSGMRMRVRSGWPVNVMPNMS